MLTYTQNGVIDDGILEVTQGVPGQDLSPIKLLRELTSYSNVITDLQMVIMINEELIATRQELKTMKELLLPKEFNEQE